MDSDDFIIYTIWVNRSVWHHPFTPC